jgi:hypothetical protein
MADNGSNAWKQYNSILVQMMESAQKHLQDLRCVKHTGSQMCKTYSKFGQKIIFYTISAQKKYPMTND